MEEVQPGVDTSVPLEGIQKSRTGVGGFDEITGGGLPTGRPTLVCGGPGCGKTLFAMQFLVSGLTRFDEPGVFMSFEESSDDLAKNVASLGFDLNELIASGKMAMDTVIVERSEIEESGEYDLEGLFLRLDFAIRSVGAKRVVLDTIESLFSGFNNQAILRAELRRLFRFLKDRGVTVVLTGERGEGQLTRQGLEEYVSDCVILLDHRINEQVSTRRLRIVKYRGSSHGTNEYPFIIDQRGLEVLPITALHLQHAASEERISSGVPRLDTMLGGEGFFRGTSVLVSGTAGTGKSSLSAHFADATCRRGERCTYFALEESQQQIIRNMRSIGLDLEQWTRSGLLQFHASRPTLFGLEMHLATIFRAVTEFEPQVVIVDPLSNLSSIGSFNEVMATLLRMIDFLKARQITAMFTSLVSNGDAENDTQLGVSSLMDTWLSLRNLESNGERNRGLYVLKSRGMHHSNQIREFLLTDHGVQLVNVYLGAEGILTGSARLHQEARERAESALREEELAILRRRLDRRKTAMEAQISSLRAEFEAEEEELAKQLRQAMRQGEEMSVNRAAMASIRGADSGNLAESPTDLKQQSSTLGK
ncbi:MAG TPA: circadian clock protein KaiC [Thermoanaerobaculia bacterium]|jgi:circadian clock protein KaiC|nr:circadian clock protein KaiC [Thermoanaerobaculia bacterium]